MDSNQPHDAASTESTTFHENAQPNDVQIGEKFFQWRDYTAIPLAVLILIFADPSASSATIGLLLVLFGEAIRIYSVAFIGSISRTRKDNVGNDLIDTGPYRAVRNPLYVGNFFIVCGIASYSGRFMLFLLTVALFAVQYHYIVIYEESILMQRFGQKFIDFKARTPGWIPNSAALRELETPRELGPALRSERNTLGAIIAMITLILLFHSKNG